MSETQTAETTPSTDATSTPKAAKSATVTLSSTGAKLTLYAVRKGDNTATTFAVTTDTTGPKPKHSRGLTETHATFEAAKAHLAKLAAQAVAKGWTRKAAGRGFVAKPDAFSSLPSPKAVNGKKGEKVA